MGPISRTPKKTERHRNAVSYDPTAGEPPASQVTQTNLAFAFLVAFARPSLGELTCGSLLLDSGHGGGVVLAWVARCAPNWRKGSDFF